MVAHRVVEKVRSRARHFGVPEDIILLAGQSNVYVGETLDSGVDVSHSRVLQIAQNGVVTIAQEPLPHPVPLADAIGHGHTFARDFYRPNALSAGRNVLLVPYAVGNTGFSDNRWNSGDDLYTGAVNLTKKALARHPDNAMVAVLWMQGEREAQAAWTQNQYQTALGNMVTAMRSALGSFKFVCGGMVPGWVAADGTRQGVQDALANVAGYISNAAYADPSSPSDVSSGSVQVHYTAAAQRLFAGRFWTAYNSL